MGLKFEELAIKANHEDEKLNNAADKELKSRMRFGRPTKSSGLLDKKFKIFGLISALTWSRWLETLTSSPTSTCSCTSELATVLEMTCVVIFLTKCDVICKQKKNKTKLG